MVFLKLHFRIKETDGDVERVLALIGMQKGAERAEVGNLWVVWIG